MKNLILGIATVAATIAVAAAPVAAAPATAKPGFGPGVWIGKGTISGTTTEGPFTTHLDGGITFRLKVDAGLRASGSGAWRLNMLGSQDGPSSGAVDSTMQGSAAIRLAGTGAVVTFTGTQKVIGEIRTNGSRRPLSFSRPLVGKLTITRAGTCKVTGGSRVPGGGTLKWTAVLQGSGTCRT